MFCGSGRFHSQVALVHIPFKCRTSRIRHMRLFELHLLLCTANYFPIYLCLDGAFHSNGGM
jgi:hypothetical protein